MEDELELNEQTKKDIEETRKRFKKGEGISHEEVMKKYGM